MTKTQSINFTQASLDAIKVPDSGRVYAFDTKLPNLGVSVTANGAKSFLVRGTTLVKNKEADTEQWKTKRHTLGRYPAMKIEQARKQARAMVADLAAGIDPTAEKQSKATADVVLALTVEDAVDLFCKKQRKGSTEKPLKPRTIQDYKYGIQKLIGEDRYLAPLADLDRDVIRQCYEDRLEESKARAANEMRSLSAVWNWVARQDAYEDQLPPNPVAAVKAKRKLYKPKGKSGRLIVKGEVNELADWMAEIDQLDPITREFFEWMLFTGNRLGEVVALQWKDFNWRTGEYRLEDPKNREAVDLPIPGYLKARLRARKKKAGPVFPVLNLGRKAREEVSEAIGKGWTNHDLRRTFAGIAQGAVPYTSVKRLMNHAYTDITEIYIGEAADLQEELGKVERRILKLAGRTAGNVVPMERVK